MTYATENKLPIFWIGGAVFAQLSLGPLGAAAVALFWWRQHNVQICQRNGWLDSTPELPAQSIGPQTLMSAIDVPAKQIGESVPVVNLNNEIHNHIPEPTATAAPKTASPAQAQLQTEPPDLSLYPDVQQRIQVLLRAMAAAGMPLGQLLQVPFVWCHGQSQSGKTTIAMMLSLARMAMGGKVEYISADEDHEPLAWSRLVLGDIQYLDRLEECAAILGSANKGSLTGQNWVFDEMLAAHRRFGAELGPLLTNVLMKGAKTGIGLIGISQADTSSAHGFSGIDSAWRSERVSVQAIPSMDEWGGRSPSGRYLVTQDGEVTEWVIPAWMLIDLNKYGSPCPVAWMMARFPELVDRFPKTPPQPLGEVPAWAVQDRFSAGSAPVQDRFSGSESVQGSAHGSEPVQGLNPSELRTFGDFNLTGSGFEPSPEPVRTALNQSETPLAFTNLNLNREDAIARIQGLKGLGSNQAQIIFSLWGERKGGSSAYAQALEEYRALTT